MLKIQEIGNLHNNYIKLWFMALFVIHLIMCQPMGEKIKNSLDCFIWTGTNTAVKAHSAFSLLHVSMFQDS